MKIANDNPKLSFLLPFCHSCESRNPGLFSSQTKEKTTTLDPRLLMSRMTEGRDSFFCHSCESRNPVLIFVACEQEKATTLDPCRLPGSPIRSSITNVEDRRRGQASRMTEGRDSFFCHSCESRNPVSFSSQTQAKTKDKTLDPLLDWIHSLTGSPIRSGTSVGDKRRG